MTLALRHGRPDDASACGAICYEAFKTISNQHNFPPDVPSVQAAVSLLSTMLARPDVYSVVAELDGRVVGSNFLWEGSKIGGVGPITVDPTAQNKSIGRRLMLDVMERGKKKGKAGLRLVQAAFHNRSMSLYAKLAFDVREPLATMQGPPLKLDIPGYVVRGAEEQDLKACNRVCVNVHGHDRSGEVVDAIKLGSATVVEYKGRVSGYATTMGFFGHAVAESNEALKALIAEAPVFLGPGFLLPTRNGELFRWCLERGLRVVQPMTLMSTGFYQEPEGAYLPSIVY